MWRRSFISKTTNRFIANRWKWDRKYIVLKAQRQIECHRTHEKQPKPIITRSKRRHCQHHHQWSSWVCVCVWPHICTLYWYNGNIWLIHTHTNTFGKNHTKMKTQNRFDAIEMQFVVYIIILSMCALSEKYSQNGVSKTMHRDKSNATLFWVSIFQLWCYYLCATHSSWNASLFKY